MCLMLDVDEYRTTYSMPEVPHAPWHWSYTTSDHLRSCRDVAHMSLCLCAVIGRGSEQERVTMATTENGGLFDRTYTDLQTHTHALRVASASTTHNNGDNSTVTAVWTHQEAVDNATTSCASGRKPSANRHANIDRSRITNRKHSFL